MNVTGSRMRQIGWFVVLAICFAAFLALTFKVNSVKSDVRLAERQIVALERDKLLYETEFETLSNQRQLADWNKIEFGYGAPNADQYLENERQLASLGLPRSIDAPAPIRVARAMVETDDDEFPSMLSPLTGKPVSGDGSGDERDVVSEKSDRKARQSRRSLADRLSTGGDLTGYMTGSAE